MDKLRKLYINYTGQEPVKLEEIPCAVSTRRYYRITGKEGTLIGTYSPDILESRAFLTYCEYFTERNIHVPRVVKVSDDLRFYLQEDLGTTRLHELVVSRPGQDITTELETFYRNSITELVKMQVSDEDLDYSVGVPRPSFDQQAVLWDLYHFKYYFLKPVGIPYDEERLEQAFRKFADYISLLPEKGFMFRDFQTRNIMIKDGNSWFIDFQGGRKGPLQYDLASLLYESRTALPVEFRKQMMTFYLEELRKFRKVDEDIFKKDFFNVVLIRMLQVLGTYGLRGMVEKKAVFLQSIPHGLRNLGELLPGVSKADVDPYILELLGELARRADEFLSPPERFDGLTITITSFSYRRPLPDDLSGNGGGFVYDCRYIENPGRFDEYRELTGLDEPVREFLEKMEETRLFFDSIVAQMGSVVDKYRQRKYPNLMVSFGCTGGRHRSVYMASRLAGHLRGLPGIRVIERHRELNLD